MSTFDQFIERASNLSFVSKVERINKECVFFKIVDNEDDWFNIFVDSGTYYEGDSGIDIDLGTNPREAIEGMIALYNKKFLD